MGIGLKQVAIVGLRRGLVDGSRRWLALGVVAGFLQLARRAWARNPVVEEFRVGPGETLEIRHFDRDR